MFRGAGEVVEARRRVGMLGAAHVLVDRQRALEEQPRGAIWSPHAFKKSDVARGVGSGPHFSSVLQEGRESVNNHASSGVTWGIPDNVAYSPF